MDMGDEWLEIADENINVEEIMRRIRERIAGREGALPSGEADPKAIADGLWMEMIGDPTDETIQGRLAAIRPRDCDIVPRYYAIEWRLPILGPIHAIVRRLINAEVRRYLTSSLEKQSSLNRQMLQILQELAQENVRLRQRVQELTGTKEQ
jgi:hypothetical protein